MTAGGCGAACPFCLAGLCHGCDGCRGEGGHRIADRQLAGRWIGIIGSRHHGNLAQLDAVLADLPPPAEAVIVSGACPTDDPGNIDQRVAEAARARGYPLVEFEADWKRWGKRAGPVRNVALVGAVHELVALPWFDGKGTADAVTEARRRQVPVRRVAPRAAQLVVHTARLDPRLNDPDLFDITRLTAINHDKALSEDWKRRFPRKPRTPPSPAEMAGLVEEARGRARLGYSLLEIQRGARAKGQPSLGGVFAPSWPLVAVAKRGLEAADKAAQTVPPPEVVDFDPIEEAERIAGEVWEAYLNGWDGDDYGAAGFRQELHDSPRTYRAVWGWVLGRSRVVLACFCSRPSWWRMPVWECCHRFVVARAFELLGATYTGELALQPEATGSLFA